jgi:aryl-alcohol dehydrogenase
MEITAAVLEEVGGAFVVKTLALSEPAPGEVLIKIAGVGVCHTDIAVAHGHLPFPLPGVVGHEGSGVVAAVGSGVTKVAVGDRVAASFNSCGVCASCTAGTPGYCVEFMPRNFAGVRADGSSPLTLDDAPVGADFFGQSSFATHAMAHERNVVKVPDGIPLHLVGPLGCGVQTGAGAVMNSMPVKAGDSVLVLGGGSVGLSAVLGAVVRGAGTIIVVEPVAQRRELALSLGATHVIDPAAGVLSEQVRAILPTGVQYAVDTTALVPVLEQVIGSMAQRGTLGLVGVPADPATIVPLSMMASQMIGLKVIGIIEGDSDPDVFIPELIELHLAGRFPFDKIITTMPFAKINDAIAAQARGEAVKVVLVHE